jgi:predicted glycoside hydrolase/deacetylase ChbG (UPF0249 family)
MKLITRADDAGSCESADIAVLESARAGVLKNASIMVPGPTFEHAVSVLRDTDLCFGLHVVLNAEWTTVRWGPVLPATDVASLVEPDGTFTPTPKHLYDRGFVVEEATAEIRAQLAKARAAGLDIRYVDQHMGVGWIGLRHAIAELCAEEGLVNGDDFEYLEVRQQGEEDSMDALRRSVAESTHPVAVYVNHPGFDRPDMQEFVHEGLEPGFIARERDGDRKFWMDPRLSRMAESGAFTPIRYDQA